MGLAERRAQKTFEEGKLKELSKEIQKAAGKEIKVDIQWEGLMEDGMDHLYEEAWTKVYFEPTIKALTSICSDAMGKEAIAEGLDTLVVKNEGGFHSPRSWSTFENKVLTLDHKPHTNIDNVNSRSEELIKKLEDNL